MSLNGSQKFLTSAKEMGPELLFNTKDLETMFGMFDVTRKGTITMKQVPCNVAPGHRFCFGFSGLSCNDWSIFHTSHCNDQARLSMCWL